MATVHGPPVASHPPDMSRKAANGHNIPRSRMTYQPVPPAPPQPQSKPDPFYGHESIARLCGCFITHLFACPENPPSSAHSQAKLPYFIAYALHRTKLHVSVTFAALVLLQRLKARFPTARGSSGHRLFISAFMIASKVICDDTYSNKSWSIVAQGMFTLREINQMEREMCNYLDWELTVDNPILANFMDMVKRDFRGQGPYPTYSLQMVSKRAAKAAASTSATPMPEPNVTTSPIPMFGQQRHSSTSPPKPTQRPPPPSSYVTPPLTPDTPSPSYSNSTSPASSASPATPPSTDDFQLKIHDVESSPGLTIVEAIHPTHPLKGKMFAFAIPSVW